MQTWTVTAGSLRPAGTRLRCDTRLCAPYLQGEGIQLELRRDDSYEEVSAALARRLGLEDSLKLRFTGKGGCAGGTWVGWHRVWIHVGG